MPETTQIVACPTCSGPLHGETKEWVCVVGHRFTFPELADGQADAVVRTLWYALRALEDRAISGRYIATDLDKSGLSSQAARLRAQNEDDLAMVDKLHELLLGVDGTRGQLKGHADHVSHDEPPGQGSHS